MHRSVARAGLCGVGLVGAIAAFAAPGSAQTPAPTLRVNAMEIQVGGRVQTQFNTTSVDGEPESEMLLRRVRLEVTVRANRLVSGKLAPDFAGDRVSMKDAYLKLDFTPGVQFLAGKAYRPFSLLEQTSSTRTLPIERGLAIRGLDDLDVYELVHDLQYSDRDVGLQVMGAPRGAPLGLSYAAGVFSGPLARQTGDQATYQYAARATVRPLAGAAVGASWSNRAFRNAVPGGIDIERGNAFEVDAELGTYAPGWHLLVEASAGDYDPFAGSDFAGASAWLAYRTRPLSADVSAVEPVFRTSYATIDGLPNDMGGALFTPGINVYLGGLNRLMLNYDIWRPRGGGGTESSLKTQFQVAF